MRRTNKFGLLFKILKIISFDILQEVLIGIGRESNELKRSGTIGNVYELRHIIYELRHVIALLTLTIPLNN